MELVEKFNYTRFSSEMCGNLLETSREISWLKCTTGLPLKFENMDEYCFSSSEIPPVFMKLLLRGDVSGINENFLKIHGDKNVEWGRHYTGGVTHVYPSVSAPPGVLT